MATKKKPTAKQLAARRLFAQRAKSGAFRRKANPARKRKAKPVGRPSQASGKRPSARLVKRRQRTARAPKGFYANPATAPARFAVHRATSDGHAGAFIASFAKKADAVAYGRAMVKAKGIAIVIVGKAR